jgi:hypothetical protein
LSKTSPNVVERSIHDVIAEKQWRGSGSRDVDEGSGD